MVKARLIEQRKLEDENNDVNEDDDRNIEDELRRLASTSASRIYPQTSGYLLPRSAIFVKSEESEIVENLEEIDDDQIYSIS